MITSVPVDALRIGAPNTSDCVSIKVFKLDVIALNCYSADDELSPEVSG